LLELELYGADIELKDAKKHWGDAEDALKKLQAPKK
jgi:hypothetical protein